MKQCNNKSVREEVILLNSKSESVKNRCGVIYFRATNPTIPVKRRAHEVLNKTFSELKEECKQEGELFVDPEFPPDDSSLFFQQRPRMRMEWKRPHVG